MKVIKLPSSETILISHDNDARKTVKTKQSTDNRSNKSGLSRR